MSDLLDAEWALCNETDPRKRAEAKANYNRIWEKVHGAGTDYRGGRQGDLREVVEDGRSIEA